MKFFLVFSIIPRHWNFMEFLVMNQKKKKKKISMRTKRKIQNQTNSRCKTQLWDAVAELWRNCAAAKSSTRSSAFSSSSWCPYKVDERKRGMAETSRHPKQSKEKEVTRRTMVLRWMFQKKRKGRKKSSRREKKVSSKPGQNRSCPRPRTWSQCAQRTFQIFVLGAMMGPRKGSSTNEI